MKSPESPVTLPLDYAAELAMEVQLIRGECSELAGELLGQNSPDAEALQECALLDEALSRAHAILQSAIHTIRQAQNSRSKAGR